ncbi:MAG: aspartate carbamoyltransferase [Clostridiales bacterium]|nr:aspartate carbamoyltransferase [Clostridiales bacterium]
MRHLIDSTDLSLAEVDRVLNLADEIIRDPAAFGDCCRGRILATLFYEPSTRTRLSFEAAMLRLGGQVEGFSSAANTSVSKGETVADTIRVVGSYADIVAMRHPKEGAPKVASLYSPVPIINAGDGGHQHPTQTLTDLLTIRSLKGRLSGITIGLCGDLKYGRTVHSLIKSLSRYENVRFILISPDELKVPRHLIEEVLEPAHLSYQEVRSLEEVIGELDVLYMTRIQQERFLDRAEYERLKDSYVLDAARMKLAKEDMIVLHPLPRVNEIAPEVDGDPRAAYFKQVKFGMYVRMALILTLLGIKNPLAPLREEAPDLVPEPPICKNPACITTGENGLPQRFVYTDSSHTHCKCFYCEHDA